MLTDEFESNLREALLRQAQDVPAEVVARLRGHHYRPRGPRRYQVIGLAGIVALAGGVAAAAVVTLSAQSASRPARLSWRLVSDVGDAWQVSQAPNIRHAFSLSCPTASTCYARVFLPRLIRLPSSGVKVNAVAIEVTHDGGARWQRADLPADVSAANGQFDPIDCLSKDTCMTLVASTAWHYEIAETTDGGQTWTTLPGPKLSTEFGVARGISCTSTTSCVFIGSYVEGTSKAGQWDAEVTTDGGQTWTQVPMPTSVGWGVQCFVGGNCITPGAYSTDGGRTWSEGALPSGIREAEPMSCGDSSHCMAIAVDRSGAQVVIVTTDGGQTWTQVSGASLASSSSLDSMTCATASNCWVAGGTGEVEPVLGQHQHQQPQPVLESTDDQGQTWLAAQLPGRYGITAVVRVSCPTATSCFAIAFAAKGLVFLSNGS